mmetsp:Transcript_10791/g.16236  ORF Transcript_10791/g.16236 Transcript_10791/m.16236 type:complete len:266 (+) Transcript_10791:362-1159(+)
MYIGWEKFRIKLFIFFATFLQRKSSFFLLMMLITIIVCILMVMCAFKIFFKRWMLPFKFRILLLLLMLLHTTPIRIVIIIATIFLPFILNNRMTQSLGAHHFARKAFDNVRFIATHPTFLLLKRDIRCIQSRSTLFCTHQHSNLAFHFFKIRIFILTNCIGECLLIMINRYNTSFAKHKRDMPFLYALCTKTAHKHIKSYRSAFFPDFKIINFRPFRNKSIQHRQTRRYLPTNLDTEIGHAMQMRNNLFIACFILTPSQLYLMNQ